MKVRIVKGYRVIYMPDHPRAMKSKNWKGWVYEHIVIAEKKYNRSIDSKIEQVHHDDENKLNNSEENILVKPIGEHTKEHSIKRAINNGTRIYERVCKNNICKKIFKPKNRIQYYCCDECFKFTLRKVERPTKEELHTLIISGISRVKIGIMFGVSDNTIKKWQRYYGLIK